MEENHLCHLRNLRTDQSDEDWLGRVLIDLKVENEKITRVATKLVRAGLELGGQQAGAEAGTAPLWRFDLDNTAVRAHLREQVIRVRNVNETTREALKQVLVNGLEKAKTLNELIEDIGEVMGRRADAQAYRIANTEMHEALSAGRYEGFKEAGVRYQAWLTSGRGVEPEGPVRRSHWGAEQATREQPLAVGGWFVLTDPETGAQSRCQYPGAGHLPPGERIHCSCVVVMRETPEGRQRTWADVAQADFVGDGILLGALMRDLDHPAGERRGSADYADDADKEAP